MSFTWNVINESPRVVRVAVVHSNSIKPPLGTPAVGATEPKRRTRSRREVSISKPWRTLQLWPGRMKDDP